MPFQTTIEQQPACLCFHFSNVLYAEQVEAVLQSILTIRQEQGITHVLCDMTDQEDTLGMLDLYQLGMQVSGQEFSDIRIAIFSKKISPSVEFFTKIVEKCSGRIQKFHSQQAAREWLFQAAPQPAPGRPPGK